MQCLAILYRLAFMTECVLGKTSYNFSIGIVVIPLYMLLYVLIVIWNIYFSALYDRFLGYKAVIYSLGSRQYVNHKISKSDFKISSLFIIGFCTVTSLPFKKIFFSLFLSIFKYFQILFKKVLKGEVTPDHLIRMSPEELASKELAAWRRRENRHVRLAITLCLTISKPIFFQPSSYLSFIKLVLKFCLSFCLISAAFLSFSQIIRLYNL